MEIDAKLGRSDTSSGRERVPPMAVVRYIRDGKTRALYEIANMMHGRCSYRKPAAVIYISFNDFSSLLPVEQDYPLKALCQPIAFAALVDPPPDTQKEEAFTKFLSEGYDIGPE